MSKTADIVNQCDGCRRGQPLNEAGTHFTPGTDPTLGDRQNCTRGRYLPKWMMAWQRMPYRDVAGTIIYLHQRGLSEAADVLTAVYEMQPFQGPEDRVG